MPCSLCIEWHCATAGRDLETRNYLRPDIVHPQILKQEENHMVQAVVGANWGDEGKGKIVDTLADRADIVVRYQGGANAGHTIVNQYGKFALHTLPSGVCHPECTNVLGNGVALNIPLVVKEIGELVSRGGSDLRPGAGCHELPCEPGCV